MGEIATIERYATVNLLHFISLLRKIRKIPFLATISRITFSSCFSFPSPTLLHKTDRSTVTRLLHQIPTPSLRNSPSLPRSQPQGIEMRNADRLLDFLSKLQNTQNK